MIVLCYGVTKSGSTLAYELTRALLAARGFAQRRLADGVVSPGHPGNFLVAPDEMRLQSLSDAVAPGEVLAVKLHGDLPSCSAARLAEPGAASRFRVLLSYRDPREICLSLLDAGVRARALDPEATRGFGAVIQDFDAAVRFTAKQIGHCLLWAGVPGVLPLYYDDVAFGGDAVLARMASHLGLAPFTPAELAAIGQQVRQHTDTLRNKAVPGRYRELDAVREAQLQEAMPLLQTFIARACTQRDYGWLASAGQTRRG